MTGIKISELDPAATLDGTELIPLVQNGVTLRSTISATGGIASVTWFGAKGDGVTDDTAAFQAAAATGKTVIVPVPAVYYLITNGNIAVASNTEFIGLGTQAAKIQLGPTTLNPLFITGTTGTKIAFRNLWLVGNRETQTSVSSGSIAIFAGVGSSDITIDGCLVEDWTDYGIVLDGVTAATVSNNTVRRIHLRSGIACSVTTLSTNIQVSNNSVSNTEHGNIQAYVGVNSWIVTDNYLDTTGWVSGTQTADNITGYSFVSDGGGFQNIIAGNICKNSQNNGMHVGGTSILIANNIVIDPFNAGIIVQRAPNATPEQGSNTIVIGNDISFATGSTAGNNGIQIRDANGFTISGNIIRTANSGIFLSNFVGGFTTDSGTIYGNTIIDSVLNSIHFTGTISNVTIDNNVLHGGTQDIAGVTDFNAIIIGANNYSSAATTIIPRLTVTAGTGATVPAIKASGSDTDISIGLTPKGAGVVESGKVKITMDSAAAATPGGITIHDTSTPGSWATNTVGAGISLSSADPSGPGAGIRLRFGQSMATASGTLAYFSWETAPVTAGTMVPVANLTVDGSFNLSSTVASTLGFPKFQISGSMDRASWGTTVGILTNIAAATITDTTSAGAAVVAARFGNYFGVPTFASTNAITATLAANVYIAGIPVGSNTTLTTAYALYSNGATFVNGTLSATAIVATGIVTALSATAVGAGANTLAFVKASSTANLGIYFGTGDPSFSAAKGSLYTKTDATTAVTRLWVNTDGSTTWAFFTASA